ncbi:alpha/beta hydrolase [Streptomyces spiroverticillatus]|uniref:Alpha/beta hydrolase n=2 Tax=Streptomyces finlayi TaxID=67296 RepID=A0A919CGA0_9ACTN|nr:alpha/beta hydrolase [Streptomyces spiroverticillatus]GHD18062.1 alpha/beta hydrolase [Streptomyces finlayi]
MAALTPATAFAAGDPLQKYAQQKLRWERCEAGGPAGFECAKVKVPLNYSDPGGRTIDLAISRIKAGNAKERHGVLLMNSGGPGIESLTMPLGMEPRLSAEVRARFDLIGFDPRGVGQSAPISCGLTADEMTSYHPHTARTFPKDVARARSVADKCWAKAGDVLPHLTTRNTARDMDIVRAALRERKISYFGYSYGTYLGAVYTQMFPRRSDRFVLDSALDPKLVWRGSLRGVAPGAELAFTRWTEWAAARHATYGLGPTPEKVRKAYWDLVARADRTPVDTTGGAVDGGYIRSQYGAFVGVRTVTPWIVALKASAAGGPPAPAGPAASPVTAGAVAPESAPVRSADARAKDGAFSADVPVDNQPAVTWATFCGDTRSWPRDPEQYRRDVLRDRAKYPLAGDLGAGVQPCAFWKSAAGEPATVVSNDAHALIVQNEWDPQATLAMAQGMRRALHGARMVTVAGGEGHGAVVAGPSCADAAVTRYLAQDRLPANDYACGAS